METCSSPTLATTPSTTQATTAYDTVNFNANVDIFRATNANNLTFMLGVTDNSGAPVASSANCTTQHMVTPMQNQIQTGSELI